MLLFLAVSVVHYRFQALDFIPIDLNDSGWIVGETRSGEGKQVTRTAVLWRDGQLLPLGSFGGTGSATAVNNKGHILITCDYTAVPKSQIPAKGVKPPKYSWDRALLFWAKGQTHFLGVYAGAGRLLDSDRFIARSLDHYKILRIVNGKPIATTPPTIPSLPGEGKTHTYFSDLNEQGTLVGNSDFGAERAHAIVVKPNGKVIDIHPNVDMHTWWSANFLNARGDVLGYQSYDSSVGGGGFFIWRSGALIDLPSHSKSTLRLSATSFNDHDQATGAQDLYGSYSEIHAIESRGPDQLAATTHAVLWSDGQLFDLNDLTDIPNGCVLAAATKINNRGWIIGTAVLNHKLVGFLLKPESQN